MKKWYDEEYEFEVEVTGFLRSSYDWKSSDKHSNQPEKKKGNV